MEPKPKRNNQNHPWKKAFSWNTAKAQKAVQKELEKIKNDKNTYSN